MEHLTLDWMSYKMQPTQSAYKTQFANLDASGHGQENRETRRNASHFQQFSLIALQQTWHKILKIFEKSKFCSY